VEITERGITVSGEGGAILVKRVQPEGSAKMAAFEYAQSVSMKAGDRFGQKPNLMRRKKEDEHS
jgi:methionyl-tRNA formyltransferase